MQNKKLSLNFSPQNPADLFFKRVMLILLMNILMYHFVFFLLCSVNMKSQNQQINSCQQKIGYLKLPLLWSQKSFFLKKRNTKG